VAEDRDLAARAAEDPLRAPVVARYLDRVRPPRGQLHAVGLDQQVDHEGAAGLALAVQAVAAMDEQRLGRKPVPNRAARTPALALDGHVADPTGA
jgi:hypothetical protein